MESGLIILLQCASHLNLGHVIRVMDPSSKSTTTTISSTTLSTTVSGGFNIGTMFNYRIAEVDPFFSFEFPPPPREENPNQWSASINCSLKLHQLTLPFSLMLISPKSRRVAYI